MLLQRKWEIHTEISLSDTEQQGMGKKNHSQPRSLANPLSPILYRVSSHSTELLLSAVPPCIPLWLSNASQLLKTRNSATFLVFLVRSQL